MRGEEIQSRKLVVHEEQWRRRRDPFELRLRIAFSCLIHFLKIYSASRPR